MTTPYIFIQYRQVPFEAYPFLGDALDYWNRAVISHPQAPNFSCSTPLSLLPDCGIPLSLGPGFITRGLFIVVTHETLDGIGGSSAEGRPCIQQNNIPRVGILRLDSADLGGLILSGKLYDIARREMAFMLGFGVNWRAYNVGSPFAYTYSGVNGRTGYGILDGSFGSPFPRTETNLYSELIGITWSEEVFDDELMTGFFEPGSPEYVSIMTLMSFQDLGYIMNLGAADPGYTLPGFNRVATNLTILNNCTSGDRNSTLVSVKCTDTTDMHGIDLRGKFGSGRDLTEVKKNEVVGLRETGLEYIWYLGAAFTLMALAVYGVMRKKQSSEQKKNNKFVQV
eukprot:snap_masked-scaffold_1-processed-gene-14.28-mRNA-1 protein AED:1.00 eAED:1.00 QI:0/-1/0/0/-1/1/1/0/338